MSVLKLRFVRVERLIRLLLSGARGVMGVTRRRLGTSQSGNIENLKKRNLRTRLWYVHKLASLMVHRFDGMQILLHVNLGFVVLAQKCMSNSRTQYNQLRKWSNLKVATSILVNDNHKSKRYENLALKSKTYLLPSIHHVFSKGKPFWAGTSYNWMMTRRCVSHLDGWKLVKWLTKGHTT